MPLPTPHTRTDAQNFRRLKTLLPKHKINLYLFGFACIFSLYDTVSTVLCIDALGYYCEANILLRWVIHNFGVAGFIGVKLCVTLIVLIAVYYIIMNSIHFGQSSTNGFYSIYLGVIISNAYAGTSNVSVIIRNSSFYFLNLNAMQMVLLLVFLPSIIVLLSEITHRCRI